MYGFALFVGLLATISWLYLLLARGRFWDGGLAIRREQAAALTTAVTVVVPARDEAATIGQCVSSLLNQDAPVHVIVVDDGSTDGTADAARLAAEAAGQSALLTIVRGSPPPPYWTGKLWAMQQGLAQAGRYDAQYLLLTDADVVHAPGSLATLVSLAEESSLDIASFMVKLRCETQAEKLLIPAFVFFFLKLYPPAWIADPRRKTAGAAGGCILIRPDSLAKAGGLERIRGEIIDDCALARAVKRSGGTVWLGLATVTASVRGYGSFAQIGRMIARSAFSQLRHSALWLLLTFVGLAVMYLAPVALLFAGRTVPTLLGAVAWLLMCIAYLPMVRFYGRNALWALTLPLAAVFYMSATVKSALDFWSGRGGQWKGRAQDVRAAVP